MAFCSFVTVERSENFSVRRALSDDIQYRTKATFVL